MPPFWSWKQSKEFYWNFGFELLVKITLGSNPNLAPVNKPERVTK